MFEVGLGQCLVVLLQRENGDCVDDVRAVRIHLQKSIEVLLSVGVAAFSDQCARQQQLGLASTRIALQEVLQEGDGRRRRFAHQELRMEKCRHLPLRAQLHCLADLVSGPLDLPGGVRRKRDGVVGLGDAEEGPADRVDQPENGQPVGRAGKHAVQPEQVFRQSLRVALQ